MARKRAKTPTVKDVASQGGRARAEALSPDERTEIARRAAETRWSVLRERVTPRATHTGDIRIGSVELPCAVLDDGIGGADPGRGSGLRGLADRIEAIGGSFEVTSTAGQGTAVRAELPLRSAERAV